MKMPPLVLATILFFCFLTNLFSQGVAVGPNGIKLPGFGEVDLEKTVEHWANLQREQIVGKMDLQIARIIAVCELDELEAKKFRIAAKGVISKRIAVGSQQIKEFAFESGLVQVKTEIEGTYASQDKLKFYGARQAADGVVEFKSYFDLPLFEHPLWKNTLKKTLSPKRFERYKQHQLATNQRLFEIGIDSWIANLNSEVFLSADQIVQIKARIEELLNDSVTISSPATLKQAVHTVDKEFGTNAESLGELLNEQQTARRLFLLKPQQRVGVGWGSGPDR